MTFSPEVKSADLFKTSLLAMSTVQQKVLSQSFLKDSKSSALFASQCGKIAIASAVIAFASAIYDASFNKTATDESARKRPQEKDVSWSSTFALLGLVSTAFFTYQWFSHTAESQRLLDLSEYIIEWISEAN
ncbi:MAG: hypothetical protein KFB93_02170 [Simkaniaceae bacterium]|nr:MAG: hypothetical protein KFB93_02170 [Simkaniaceae bacterium]